MQHNKRKNPSVHANPHAHAHISGCKHVPTKNWRGQNAKNKQESPSVNVKQESCLSSWTRQKLCGLSYLYPLSLHRCPDKIAIPRLGRTGTPTRSCLRRPFRSAPLPIRRSARCPVPNPADLGRLRAHAKIRRPNCRPPPSRLKAWRFQSSLSACAGHSTEVPQNDEPGLALIPMRRHRCRGERYR